jgi:hypothetical protein
MKWTLLSSLKDSNYYKKHIILESSQKLANLPFLHFLKICHSDMILYIFIQIKKEISYINMYVDNFFIDILNFNTVLY